MVNPFDAYHAQQTIAPRQTPSTNFFSRFDSEEDAAPLARDVPQQGPRNFFDRFDNEPDAEPRNTSPRPAFEDLDPLFRQYAEHQSLDNARGSARVMTDAERREFGFGNVKRPANSGNKEDASFWGSLEHGLGNRNIEAYADAIEHLADMSDDPSYAQSYREWSGSLRKTVEEDGSDYRPVFESFKQINGLSDAWGYVKEVAGEQIGIQIPGIAGAITGGYLGQKAGAPFGKVGRVTGGFTGATAGALSGMIHHHVSEMRRALQGEKVEGGDLVTYTNYGTAVLAGLDLAFPVVAGLKWSGPARQAIARKIALQLARTQPHRLRAPSIFIREFGKQIVKDAILLEVPTEIAQEAITTFVPPNVAGREVTDEEIQRFITDTVPEVAVRTVIGAGAISAPGSAKRTVQEMTEAYDVSEFSAEERKAQGEGWNKVADALIAAQTIETAEDPQTAANAERDLQAAVHSIIQDPEARKSVNSFLQDIDKRGISPIARDIFQTALGTATGRGSADGAGFGAGVSGRRAKGARS